MLHTHTHTHTHIHTHTHTHTFIYKYIYIYKLLQNIIMYENVKTIIIKIMLTVMDFFCMLTNLKYKIGVNPNNQFIAYK